MRGQLQFSAVGIVIDPWFDLLNFFKTCLSNKVRCLADENEFSIVILQFVFLFADMVLI